MAQGKWSEVEALRPWLRRLHALPALRDLVREEPRKRVLGERRRRERRLHHELGAFAQELHAFELLACTALEFRHPDVFDATRGPEPVSTPGSRVASFGHRQRERIRRWECLQGVPPGTTSKPGANQGRVSFARSLT